MNDLQLSVGLLMRPFVPRNPFSYSRLPLLSRLQLAAFRARRRAAKRLIGKPARNIYKLARALGLKGRGGLTINAGDAVYEVAFDASNTQFVPAEDAVYEPELAALLDIVLDDDGVFFDIGSNWGYFSFYTLSRKSFRGIVHAFEPYPTTHRNLNDTANQCGFGPKLICHEIALSDHDGIAQFGQIEQLHQGLARLGGSQNSVDVQTRRLDGLGLPPPDVMKIDVEGHEAAVLIGARETIARARPVIVFESWREWQKPGVTFEPFEILRAASYRFFVPSWVCRLDGKLIARIATNSRPATGDQFGLVELQPEQRFMFADQLNVLAVPVARTTWLAERFAS